VLPSISVNTQDVPLLVTAEGIERISCTTFDTAGNSGIKGGVNLEQRNGDKDEIAPPIIIFRFVKKW
jgi:hypothetical protein